MTKPFTTISPYSSPPNRASDLDIRPTNYNSMRSSESADSFSVLSIQQPSSQSSPGSCSCFQQNIDVLYSLKASEISGNTSIHETDTVLASIGEAMKPWQSLFECGNCAYNNDQEILLLVFMSLRIVLLRLRKLLPPWSSPGSGKSSQGAGLSQPQQQHAATEKHWPSRTTRVLVGSLELSGNDRIVVLHVLLSNTVSKIKSAMIRFREMLDRKMRSLGPRNPMQARGTMAEHAHHASNLDHAQQMLHTLGTLLQSLETSLDSR